MQTVKIIRRDGGPMEIWGVDYVRSDRNEDGSFTLHMDTDQGEVESDILHGDVAYIMTGPDTTHVLRPRGE